MTAPTPAPSRVFRSSKHREWAMAVSIGVAAVGSGVVLALAVVPIPQSYGFALGVSGSNGGEVYFEDDGTRMFGPAGAQASISFTNRGLNVSLTISAPNGTALWGPYTPNASVTFILPVCGWYHFDAAGSGEGTYDIGGTVSYTAPLLQRIGIPCHLVVPSGPAYGFPFAELRGVDAPWWMEACYVYSRACPDGWTSGRRRWRRLSVEGGTSRDVARRGFR